MNNIYKRNVQEVLGLQFGLAFCHHSGVGDGSIDYESGNSSPQIAMGSTSDFRNGNVDSSDNSKRPSNLDVKQKNGFPPKSYRNVVDPDNEGSLPSSPEENAEETELELAHFPPEYEVLDSRTRKLLVQFFRDFNGLTQENRKESKELTTMKRLVQSVLEKHRYTYNGMVRKLSLDQNGDDMRFLTDVAKNLFSDGTTNWGRITSLVAFGAVVSQYLYRDGRKNCVDRVAEKMATYLVVYQGEWLLKNNAWDGFVDFFRVSDPEATMRNTLLGLAGVAGIGATLALLIR